MKDSKDNQTFDMEDLILWPDGTSCYRYELHEMSFKSDDFAVIPFGSDAYNKFFQDKL